MNEVQYRIQSTHLKNTRTIWVYSPDGEATNVVIFLDGECYRESINVLPILANLHYTGQICSSLFVFVSIESLTSRSIECPCNPSFAYFIDQELMPFLEGIYPFIRVAQERVIVGLSYTGLAATYSALMALLRFTKVITQSGSFWYNDCEIIDQFEKLEIKPKTDFYLSVGLEETEENVWHRNDVFQSISQIECVKIFRDVLIRHGYLPKYVEFEGGHDLTAWRFTLPEALQWALSPQK